MNKLFIIVFVVILHLIIMPSFAFSITHITHGHGITMSESIIIICVGISLYLFGCDLEWKLNK